MEPNFGAADTSLQIEKEMRGGTLLLHFVGGFSLTNHAALQRTADEIKSKAPRKVVMDLGAVSFMDSMGVGILVAILKHAITSGIAFVMVTNDIVDQILGVTRLRQVLHAVRSLEEALAAPEK